MVSEVIERFIRQVESVVLGKSLQVKLALTCLLAKGHLLIEDLPGMGKTTLAHALSQSLGLGFQRIQFTSDLMPTDLLGVSLFDTRNHTFVFKPGPLFNHIILADEINRTTPKTQSALLEAMEELQVSIEGETRPLPSPFFVIATQNPSTQLGTFPLPESQMDRFLMCIRLGYPEPAVEKRLLINGNPRHLLGGMPTAIDRHQLAQLQADVHEVSVADPVIDYIYRLMEASRQHPQVECGISPRGGMAIVHASRAWALIHNRNYVIPDDVQSIFIAVVAHRMVCRGIGIGHQIARSFAQEILDQTNVLGG